MSTVLLWLAAIAAIGWLSAQVISLREEVTDLRRERRNDAENLKKMRQQVYRLRLRQVPAINRTPVTWLDELHRDIGRAS